ncbi:JAB domain-containing protein [Elizabethkingia ursingii]
MSQDKTLFSSIIDFFKKANPQQNEKDYENTNFNFQEDEDTKYLKTSSGQTLPYKIFQTNDSNRQSNLLWREEDQGSDSDYSLIERRFTEQKQFSFVGGDKIENLNDVAWLFRSLEDEAIEHAFIAYRFHDDSYMIQHLSSGGINSAITDLRLVAGNAIKLNPKSITLVHNHPSGQLKASHDDRQLLRVLRGFFNHTDIIVEDGVVINLRSGKYLVFDDGGLNQVQSFEKQDQEQNNVQVFSFSKQVYVENYNPVVLDKPEVVASFISSQKFGVSDKTEMLVLNNNLEIVGKVVLPQEKQVEKITEILTIYGGTRAILYGNNVTPTMVNYYNTRLANVNLHIEDAIEIKSENAQKLYKSYLEQGLIREVEKKLEFEPNSFEVKRILTDEEKELVADFKSFLRDYRNLEAIVTDPRLPVFAEQTLVLENKIKEYTETKKLSFTDYHRAYFLNRSADVISSDRVLIEMITLNQYKIQNMEKINIEKLAEKLNAYYQNPLDPTPMVNFSYEYGRKFLEAALEVLPLKEELQKAIFSYTNLEYPMEPDFWDFRDDSYDRGEEQYEKAKKSFKEEFKKYESTKSKLLSVFEKHQINPKEIESRIPPGTREYFKDLVFDLSTNLKEVLSECVDTQRANISDVVDGFENVPRELEEVMEKWQQKIENGLDYNDCANLQKECEALGYTFDYGLDSEPFNLRSIDIKEHNINNQKQQISMENSQKSQDFEIGKKASIKTENGLFKGVIEEIKGDSLTLSNFSGEKLTVNKSEAYQFFDGQNYDYSEIKELFSKPLGGVEFNDLAKEDLTRLMRGELTNTVFSGHNEEKDKDYTFKMRVEYNKADEKIEVKPFFNDNLMVYGSSVSDTELETLKSGEKLILEREKKTGEKYHVKVSYDKDLNSIIPERMTKKEKETLTITKKQNNSQKL